MQTVPEDKKTIIGKIWDCEDGYFALEAAFLMPLVCLLILAVMMTGLYICDLNQAKSYLHERVTELSRDDTAYGSEQQQKDQESIRGRLFAADLTDFYIIKSSDKVEGGLEISIKLDVPLISGWFGKIWGNSFSLSVEIGDNVEKIRRWSLLE